MQNESITHTHAFVGESAAVVFAMVWLIVVAAGPFAADSLLAQSND